MRDNRTRFNEVLISFMDTNAGPDYRSFVRQAMFTDYVQFGDAPTPIGNEDWRNLSVNAMLLHSYNAPWLWFTEQDFYPLPGFWESVETYERTGFEVIAVFQGGRMHPCCIFITRNALNQTRKNFGIVPGVSDHFSMIQEDLANAKIPVGIINRDTYFHHNGLSHNMTLLYNGEQPNYEPEKFSEWLQECLQVSVPLDQRFIELAAKMRK